MNLQDGDKDRIAEAQSEKSAAKSATPEPTAAADRMVPRADMVEAKALVASTVRRMKQKTPQSVDRISYERIKQNPLIAAAFLHLLLDHYVLNRNQPESSPSYKACLLLLELALTELRYSTKNHRAWAIEAVERIQQEMAKRAFKVEVDARVQADLVRVLHAADLEVHPEIKAGREKLAQYYGRFTGHKRKPDLNALFDDLAPPGAKDPFLHMGPIMAELNLMPAKEQAMVLGEMVQAHNPLIRELAALMLLCPNREVRVHLPAIYRDLMDAKGVSPATLGRMIGLHNWLPRQVVIED